MSLELPIYGWVIIATLGAVGLALIWRYKTLFLTFGVGLLAIYYTITKRSTK